MIEETCCECGKEMLVPEWQVHPPICLSCVKASSFYEDEDRYDEFYPEDAE